MFIIKLLYVCYAILKAHPDQVFSFLLMALLNFVLSVTRTGLAVGTLADPLLVFPFTLVLLLYRGSRRSNPPSHLVLLKPSIGLSHPLLVKYNGSLTFSKIFEYLSFNQLHFTVTIVPPFK